MAGILSTIRGIPLVLTNRQRLVLLIGSFCASEGMAQTQPTVTGLVQDARSNRPLAGAIVSLQSQAGERRTRTDEAGQFGFTTVLAGTYTLNVRRIGYAPDVRTIDVAVSNEPIVVSLEAVALLDTVRVRALMQGIYGAVGRSRDLEPLPNATVQVIGESGREITTDSGGRFYLPVKSPGAYLVRATARSYEGVSVSVTVPRNESADVVLLLDTATAASHRIEQAFDDFRERTIRRRPGAVLITRSELLRNGNTDLLTAILHAPSFTKKALRFERTACVFADGLPLVGVPVQTFDAEEVEAVEVFGRGQDASGNLSSKWSRGGACGETGMPQTTGDASRIVVWVSIWIKR